MADNPYSGLLGIMQEQGAKYNPPTICLGEVISSDPLTIKTEDLTLEHDDLLVSDILVKGYKREFVETGQGSTGMSGDMKSITQNRSGGGGYAEFASHNHDIEDFFSLDGTYEREGESQVEFKPYLKTGDVLALMPTANRQQYIVLCKVVSV